MDKRSRSAAGLLLCLVLVTAPAAEPPPDSLLTNEAHLLTNEATLLTNDPSLLASDAPLLTNAPLETNMVRSALVEDQERAEAEEALALFLKLQEQLHARILAAGPAPPEPTPPPPAAADEVVERLAAIERTMHAQREMELRSMQSSNRTLLMVATLFAGVGLLTMVCTALFQLRAMNRLAEIATISAGLPAAELPAALAQVQPRLLGHGSQGRLASGLEQLEQRIRELESGFHPMIQTGTKIPNGHGPAHDPPDARSPVATQIGKGETLLNLGKLEEALACFDCVLAEEPAHPEALLKKGMALERLRKPGEAIACYDRAIAADRFLTRAYLCKGALFNQQERFNEALACYEEALKAQSPSVP